MFLIYLNNKNMNEKEQFKVVPVTEGNVEEDKTRLIAQLAEAKQARRESLAKLQSILGGDGLSNKEKIDMALAEIKSQMLGSR